MPANELFSVKDKRFSWTRKNKNQQLRETAVTGWFCISFGTFHFLLLFIPLSTLSFSVKPKPCSIWTLLCLVETLSCSIEPKPFPIAPMLCSIRTLSILFAPMLILFLSTSFRVAPTSCLIEPKPCPILQNLVYLGNCFGCLRATLVQFPDFRKTCR